MSDEPVLTPAEKPALSANIGDMAASVLDSILEPDPTKKPDEAPPKPEKPAAEPEAKPEKVAPVLPEELPETLPNEGRSEQWKKFKHAHEELKKEHAALKGKLGDFDGTKAERDALKASLEEKDARIAELAKIDSISKLENSPEFRQKYVEKRQQAVGKIKELAGYADISPEEVIAAMSRAPKERYAALDEALSTATPTLADMIRKQVVSLEEIDSDRARELADVEASLSKQEQARAISEQERAANYAKQMEGTFAKVAAQLSKELGTKDEVISKAKDFFSRNNDLSEAAKVVIKAFAAEDALSSASELKAKVAELEGELAKYRDANPNLSSGASGTTQVKDDMDITEAILKGVQSLNLMR